MSEGSHRHPVLTDLDFEVSAGESVAILGRSGSGKSTLLSLLALFDEPDSGSYHIDGADTRELSESDRCHLRSEAFGFVFQRFFLLKHLTAAQNVELALLSGPSPPKREARRQAIVSAMESVGIGHLAARRPPQLSGGEQQRVAIARAIVNQPRILLADEPTGALDATVGDEVISLIASLANAGRSLVMVTHDREYASRLGRRLNLREGRLECPFDA